MAPALPPEVHALILAHLSSPRDLSAVTQSSRILQPHAEELLYRSIQSSSHSHTERLCTLLISTPRLCPHLRQLSISHQSQGSVSPQPAPATYWHLLAAALPSLPNLSILHIHSPAGFDNLNSWVLPTTTPAPFLLTELSVSFSLDDVLVSFLASQLTLQTLIWKNPHPSFHSPFPLCQIPSSILPSLTVLQSDSTPLAIALLPDRPITHLWISDAPTTDCDLLSAISLTNPLAGGLRSLRMGFPFHKDAVAQTLEFLTAAAPNLLSLGFIRPFNEKDLSIISPLSRLPYLHTLTLWNLISLPTLHALSESIPSLRRVACLHYSYGFEYVLMGVNPLRPPRAIHDAEEALWRNV